MYLHKKDMSSALHKRIRRRWEGVAGGCSSPNLREMAIFGQFLLKCLGNLWGKAWMLLFLKKFSKDCLLKLKHKARLSFENENVLHKGK